MSSSAAPTAARIISLTHWTTFFHPVDGIFRLPSTQGETIEHLDIDLRFVDHSHEQEFAKDASQINIIKELHLPRVCKLTLRGGEYVQDDDMRMGCLAEVLLAINPVEVQWLNAENDPAEQLTFATHLVHPAVIAAGEKWSRTDTLRKLVIQGGFPCPNLTAPTPFSLTPAATPLPSPGLHRTAFSFSRPGSPSAAKFPQAPFSGLPALSTTKPKPVDEERLKAREERRRLADYSLKPRFEYAFGTWSIEYLRWRFDGRYTPKCIVSIVDHLFRELDASFPSSSRKMDVNLPSIMVLTYVPSGTIDELATLHDKLELDEDVRAYLEDVLFVNTTGADDNYSRLWDSDITTPRERHTRRIKAEMLLFQGSDGELVSLDVLRSNKRASNDIGSDSPARSDVSLFPGETEASTEDEEQALTPDVVTSPVVRPDDDSTMSKGNEGVKEGDRSLSYSVAP